jgi:hypothetical protein
MRVLILFPVSCLFLWRSNCLDEEIAARDARSI